MSHRVTTKIDMTDKRLAKEALKEAGLSFTESGESLHITGGTGLRNATINLRDGTITGDTDYGHNQRTFSKLRCFYNLAKYKEEVFKQGGTIESVREEGENIVMMYAVG
jgi:hypothetical protein